MSKKSLKKNLKKKIRTKKRLNKSKDNKHKRTRIRKKKHTKIKRNKQYGGMFSLLRSTPETVVHDYIDEKNEGGGIEFYTLFPEMKFKSGD